MDDMEKEPMFFEGVEKLLEIWFCNGLPEDDGPLVENKQRTSDGEEDEKMSSDGMEEEPHHIVQTDSSLSKKIFRRGEPDLRRIPRSAIESILVLAKCEIISTMSSEHVDSYVLSESSLFVSKTRVILKTCGTTTLLLCVQPLIYLARQYGGYSQVLDVFYSHKNFMRPALQTSQYRSFDHEVDTLEGIFGGGAAYCLGRMNRDCWYYYTLHPDRPMGPLGVADQTLEIIMQQLDPQVMAIFTQKACKSAKEATLLSGIDKIFADAIIDDFLFEPCGYSMNGLVKGIYYFTIHITPEENCSFVSFETNYPQKNYQNLITKVVKMFNPGKFSLSLFANEKSVASENLKTFDSKMPIAYSIKDLQFSRFKNYDLTYGHFVKLSN